MTNTSRKSATVHQVDERVLFENFVRANGHIGPARVVRAKNLTSDGDCWTAAWNTARETGGMYVEGGCLLPPAELGSKPRRVRAHAWVEIETPFGWQIIECTQGYESGKGHFGVAVDCAPDSVPSKATVEWKHERASVIEAMIVLGIPSAEILRSISPAKTGN